MLLFCDFTPNRRGYLALVPPKKQELTDIELRHTKEVSERTPQNRTKASRLAEKTKPPRKRKTVEKKTTIESPLHKGRERMKTMRAKRMEELFTKKEMTYAEYADELLHFQTAVAESVFGLEDSDGVWLASVISELERVARDKGLTANPEIRDCLKGLRTANKELTVVMAGKAGEESVANMIKYRTARSNFTYYRNLFLENEEKDTELDGVVLTDNGLLVLEVKRTKSDITISSDGRLFYGNESCFKKTPFGEKMEVKRNLLRERLEQEIASRGLDIPVMIDSYLVFSTPKGAFVKITDEYQKEKHCFATVLPHLIDEFHTSVNYTDEQMLVLNDILSGIEVNKKAFAINCDFDKIKQDFAAAMKLLQAEEKTPEEVAPQKEPQSTRRSGAVARRIAMAAVIAATGVVGALLVGPALLTSTVLSKRN